MKFWAKGMLLMRVLTIQDSLAEMSVLRNDVMRDCGKVFPRVQRLFHQFEIRDGMEMERWCYLIFHMSEGKCASAHGMTSGTRSEQLGGLPANLSCIVLCHSGSDLSTLTAVIYRGFH